MLNFDLNQVAEDTIYEDLQLAIDSNKFDQCECNYEDTENSLIHPEDEIVEDGIERDCEFEEENNPVIQVEGANDNDEVSGWLVGETRETLEEIHELYCNHAAAVGFSVRKAKQSSKTGSAVITKKLFVCSAAGIRNSGKKKKSAPEIEEVLTEESSSLKKKPRKSRRGPITRTDCNALIIAKFNEENKFEIVRHVMVHNHPLTRQQWNHLHRSEHAVTEIKGQTIEAMQESGLRPMKSFNYMSNEAVGQDAMGHTLKDHMNFCYKLKMKAIEGGDSQVVCDKLQEAYFDDPNFFFRVRLDSQGRVCNLFWRDSMMLEDFKIYGDVTVFDTTYRTNRYNLICAPFVGINNHWANTMFSCSFIGDATIQSFVWLFETFKKSMGGKSPISLFTDQDAAMAAAIPKVFPNTRRRLYMSVAFDSKCSNKVWSFEE